MPEKTPENGSLPLLFYGNSYHHPDIYRSTGFLAPDPIIALEHGDEIVILASPLEQGRVEKGSRATSVRSLMEFGLRELSEQGLDSDEINATVIQRFLAERGLARVLVPRYFPVGTADRLRAKGIALDIVPDLDARRRTKRPDEVASIEKAQRATEGAWAAGVDALRRATVDADRTLRLDGEVFTAERLRTIVEQELIARDCATPDRTITAPGTQAADPHETGHGPLRANEAIVMDIYPQHSSRYWADMTRTVSKGAPPDAIVRMYEVVKRAQDEAIAMLRPGVTGRAIHERVEDIIFEAGYDTLRPGQRHRPDDPVVRGFFHGTGHGVGLEIHELPSIGRGKWGMVPLEAGDVVTIEPGIYDPDIGGVRLEDMLLVTPEGARDLTRAPRDLVIDE
ncbi:MAG: M24 family metallopeptidase [Chloroflexota bacterium]|nr:M24 family metallopeptidase [Chloroflexota bacterium]